MCLPGANEGRIDIEGREDVERNDRSTNDMKQSKAYLVRSTHLIPDIRMRSMVHLLEGSHNPRYKHFPRRRQDVY